METLLGVTVFLFSGLAISFGGLWWLICTALFLFATVGGRLVYAAFYLAASLMGAGVISAGVHGIRFSMDALSM